MQRSMDDLPEIEDDWFEKLAARQGLAVAQEAVARMQHLNDRFQSIMGSDDFMDSDVDDPRLLMNMLWEMYDITQGH